MTYRAQAAAISAADLADLCAAYEAALFQPFGVDSPAPAVLTVDAARFNVFDDRQAANLADNIRHAVPSIAQPRAPLPGHDLAVREETHHG